LVHKNELDDQKNISGQKNTEEENEFKTLKEEDVVAALKNEAADLKNMAPKIVETPESKIVKLPVQNAKITVDKSGEDIVRFELSSDYDPIPQKANCDQQKAENSDKNKQTESINKDASTAPTSGGYLAKPTQIYAEEKPKPESETIDKLAPLPISRQEDEPVEEMQLVVKNSNDAVEENQEKKVHQTMPIMMSTVEEPPMVDETEELKRRAMDRIAKLRNLSFNVNAADPNNEFESVPAYLRRNMELHNSIADVENFYSNYTVKSDENNKAEISTINSFLDGEKPD
jgi:cell division protein FtsZ